MEGKIMMLKSKMKNISIVLYKPKYAGNIGAVARAAKNMGIGDIVVSAAGISTMKKCGSAPRIWPPMYWIISGMLITLKRHSEDSGILSAQPPGWARHAVRL